MVDAWGESGAVWWVVWGCVVEESGDVWWWWWGGLVMCGREVW